ncbi:MAG TPA: TonB-dependent receptor [Steroidobacteraceae bacterium]
MKTRTAALWFSGAMSMAISIAANAAAAADVGAADEGIQEIVVTAEKRTENLQTVPVAISAYTSKTRDLIGIETIQDMTNYTPGLTYSTSLDRAYIRGVGRETNNLSTNPGVATYADNVYNSSVVAASGDSLFIDRVEIQRGPQGTLYGRNSIAGTINSISKRPTQDWYAEIRANVGNYGTHNFEGAISGPITDTLRFRFAGYRNATRDGYFTNLSNGKTESSQLGEGNYFYWEGQLEWDINPDTNFWLKVGQLGYNTAYRVPANVIGTYDYAPYPTSALAPGPAFGCTVPGGVQPANAYCTNPANSNVWNFSASDPNNAILSRTYVITPQLTWHGPGMDLKYLGAYTTYYYNLWNDYDNTNITSYNFPATIVYPPGALGPGTAGSPCYPTVCPPLTVFPSATSNYIETKHYYSNELDLSSHTDNPLQWIVGLFQYHEQNYQTPGNVFLPGQAQLETPANINFTALAAPNPDRSIYDQQQEMHSNSFAGFGQLDWKFAPTLKATLGLRYTYDVLAGSEQFRELCFGLPACLGLPNSIPGPALFGAFTPVNDITASDPAIANCFTPAGCKYPGVKNLPTLLPNGFWSRGLGASWDSPTGTAGLEWTPTDSTLLYAKYTRGYKSGGFNASTISVNPESQPEHIDAFELGGKTTINRQVQLNGALFYYNYKDLQIPLTELNPTGSGPAISSIVNLPTVHSYGAELESIWQPTASLQFLVNYAYLHATIAGNSASCNVVPAPATCYQNVVSGEFENVAGNTVPQSPKNKISVNGNYTWRFTPGSLNVSATYIWKDKMPDAIFNEWYYVAPSYSQVDARISWNDAADRYTVFLYGKNLQNKLGYDGIGAGAVVDPAAGTAACGTNSAGPYYCNQSLGLTPPRTYGIEVQVRLK